MRLTKTVLAVLVVAVLAVSMASLGAMAQQDVQQEQEPNNNAETAGETGNSITLGTTLTGEVGANPGDVYQTEGQYDFEDNVLFSVDSNQTVSFTFTLGEADDGVPLVLAADDGSIIERVRASPGGSASATVTLTSGAYYFNIGGVDAVPGPNGTAISYELETSVSGEDTPTATETATPTPTETATPTETTTEETATATETATPTEEETDGGKAKQPSDGAADGGNGKAKMGDGGDGDDSADGGNGKSKADGGDNSEVTTTDTETATEEAEDTETDSPEETTEAVDETATETDEETTTEAETDGEIDFATNASGDLNCEDFPTKDLAQQNLDNNPDDPNGLDADNDGEACDAGVDA